MFGIFRIFFCARSARVDTNTGGPADREGTIRLRIQTILVRFYLFGPMGGVSTAESENGKGQKSFQGVKDHFFVAVVSSD